MPVAVEGNDSAPARYVVGIDLGTTNSALCYVDTAQPVTRVAVFPIPQIVAPRQVEARETLPSFHYEATTDELAGRALALPWPPRDRNYLVGCYARDHGATVPSRLIYSAKSWLCHSGVDRTAELLPWQGAEDVTRLSPVEVSARYLLHLREAWNEAHREHPLEEQDLVITLPASFDEVARELTVKAAARAGLPRVVLIEEPQAAFYAWIESHGDSWESQVRPGQKILVCDVGGGTTDFTLIRVKRAPSAAGRVQFHRVAVGEHLILGGDNLDLALAHHLERKLTGDAKLTPRQWSVVVQSSRRVKEILLGKDPPQRYTLHLPGTGSKLLGGGTQVEITRDEVQSILIDGFLPRCRLDDRPVTRRSGFQEFGLPFAPDAAITRYLAAFLTAHRHVALPEEGEAPADSGDPARPDIVLFNGGFFESTALRERLLEVLSSWFSPDAEGQADRGLPVPGIGDSNKGLSGSWDPVVLRNDRLDLAVARGAAYYGMVRRGVGVKISAGLARTYYVGVETESAAHAAICLAPAGVEEGQDVELRDRTFQLLIRQPVEFPLFVSSTRLTDRAGDVVPLDREQMTALPPIRTVLQAGKRSAGAESLRIRLHVRLTEIGTLDVWCREVDSERTWRLQFDVRAATQTDIATHTGLAETEGFVEEPLFEACRDLLRETFRSGARPEQAERLVKQLERVTEMRRVDWPSSLLRRMWEVLLELEDQRAVTPVHEARWLYLAGFSLRPGYGLAVDDWRVAQTWRLFQGKKLRHGGPMTRVEWLILWRRIAGGLNSGQQQSLADPFLSTIRQLTGPKAAKAPKLGEGGTSHELAETWRLLGSMELLPMATRRDLGDRLLKLLAREKASAVREAQCWALGRIGARVPFYGPLNVVVPMEVAERWLTTACETMEPNPVLSLAVMQIARRTGDRYRDLSAAARSVALDWLAAQQAPEHYSALVRDGGELGSEERGLVFGESLPRGLKLA